MSRFKHALGNAQLAIICLAFALVLSFVLNVFLGVFLFRVPNDITVNVPPAIPASGLKIKPGEINSARVYAFTYYIWQALQTWPVNGKHDYVDNIKKFAPYLTMSFQNTLKEEGKKMDEQGFLYKHQQITFGVLGSSFSPKEVRYIGNGTWLVHLRMRTINAVAPPEENKSFNESHIAMDAETSFVFKVVRYDYSPDKNHWGLAIAGYAAPPQVKKAYK
ncbi:MAG: DUF2895 family protein [Gammaproteobacteria bacterium]|nr:DUF2895 family protein [Gammaproteobacteria bacterium]